MLNHHDQEFGAILNGDTGLLGVAKQKILADAHYQPYCF